MCVVLLNLFDTAGKKEEMCFCLVFVQTPGFLQQCSGVLCKVLEDSALVVRAKGSWAFGNLAEALMWNM